QQRLDDVAGLVDVKMELQEKVIAPFQHPEVYERFKVEVGGGILMYGPPGNGKTFMARAIAGELDAAFFNVNTSQLKDKYVGETEKNISRLFQEARAHERAVIFLDEIDHLLSRRGNQKVGMVAQFLTMMDGLEKSSTCLLVLGATNKPWAIDEAVLRPGRMGTHVYVGPPDATAREAILAYNLRGVPVGEDVSMPQIAQKTDGFSGADMSALSDRAKRFALNRQLATDNETLVSAEDFEAALEKVRPSFHAAMVAEFIAWRDRQSSVNDQGSSNDDD
ncbi:MAG: ATP-binding protein, partial [Kiritimatiellia bacterium]